MNLHATLLLVTLLALVGCQQTGPHAGHEEATAHPASPQADIASRAPDKPVVQVSHAWSRATPPGAAVGGGYVTLRNDADLPDRLVAVESAASARVEIHEMRMEGDVMKMRRLDDGLALPAHGTVQLQPGGNHLMFIEPHSPFVVGKPIKATLVFQNAPRVSVQFDVQPMGSEEPSNAASPHSMH
ncbi:copper chaperone PCu(A)C [Xanthomonas sp. A1809]|uniref:copper chaperone PCu(A)C n=1 Tax=Xanthomonas sp. A1809 TaxID=2821275 RepID=UPI001ADA5D89|nr:copper chaperone PCu(A)C [Xanthomonas sp. A1809]MBO9855122.1 copper chaperone PCu(A)C [Xanthomonas sp. A1809]